MARLQPLVLGGSEPESRAPTPPGQLARLLQGRLGRSYALPGCGLWAVPQPGRNQCEVLVPPRPQGGDCKERGASLREHPGCSGELSGAQNGSKARLMVPGRLRGFFRLNPGGQGPRGLGGRGLLLSEEHSPLHPRFHLAFTDACVSAG